MGIREITEDLGCALENFGRHLRGYYPCGICGKATRGKEGFCKECYARNKVQIDNARKKLGNGEGVRGWEDDTL